MMWTESSASTCATTTRRDSEPQEDEACLSLGMVGVGHRYQGSPKAVAASGNVTPCFLALAKALAGFHEKVSNVIRAERGGRGGNAAVRGTVVRAAYPVKERSDLAGTGQVLAPSNDGRSAAGQSLSA